MGEDYQMSTKTEIIEATFKFKIEYDTSKGRCQCIKHVMDCQKGVASFGDYGSAIVKITKKKGVIK